MVTPPSKPRPRSRCRITMALAWGSCSRSSPIAGMKRLQCAGSLWAGAWLRGLDEMDEIFGNRAPVQVQVAGDLSQRPFLVPVKAVNFVDLFVAPHGWGLILLSGKT